MATVPAGAQSTFYTYDALNRLTSATIAGSRIEYTYDAAGNLTRVRTPYTIAVTRAGNGTGSVSDAAGKVSCGSRCGGVYDVNAVVNLTAVPATGSSFAGWTGNCSGTGGCVVTVTGAMSVGATFTTETYALTIQRTGAAAGAVTSSPAGINCGGACSATFAAATPVTLTATPSSGASFENWSLAGNGTWSDPLANPAIFTILGASTIQARFGYGTTTALTTSPNPSLVDQAVTLTATVVSATPGTIAGNVAFKEGSTTIGTGSVNGSRASITTSALTTGPHSIIASYSGDASYSPSASPSVVHAVNLAAFSAPSGLTATAEGTSRVVVRWSPVAGVSRYSVERRTASSSFAEVATPTDRTFTDTGVAANTAYAYRVRALDGSGQPSAYSAPELAATFAFTDDPVVAGMPVRAVHIDELRAAVNALRALSGMAPTVFTDAMRVGLPIKAAHISELRSYLDAARAGAGAAALTYARPAPAAGSAISAADVQVIREACR